MSTPAPGSDAAVATMSMFGQRPGRARFEITVEIGKPYRWGDNPEEWACSVSVRPLQPSRREAHGNDAFQALCLAIALAQHLLQDFRDAGGVLSYGTGEEFPLEAYSFGIAARRNGLSEHEL